jgi:hypothetical protein
VTLWFSPGLTSSNINVNKTFINNCKISLINSYNNQIDGNNDTDNFDENEDENPDADDDGTNKFFQGNTTNLPSKALEKPGVKDSKMKGASNSRDTPNAASVCLRQLNSKNNPENPFYLSLSNKMFIELVQYLSKDIVGKNALRTAERNALNFSTISETEIPQGFTPDFELDSWILQFPRGTPTIPKVRYLIF